VTACLTPPLTDAPWLLVAPPEVYEDGAVRMDDDAPLPLWRRLAEFDDAAACQVFRDAQVRNAPNDEQWALWSKSRCLCGPGDAARCGPDADDDSQPGSTP